MRLVDQAVIRPHHCAVYPQLGQNHAEGFIDTGGEMPGFDNHVYVSVRAVKEMGKLIGLIERDELTVAQAQRDAAQSRIESLEEELAAKQQQLEAVRLLKSAGYVAEHKRGPKAKPKQLERSAA